VRLALSLYQRAVQHEQNGQLDEALMLYRQAFRIEPNVDQAYHTQEMLTVINTAQTLGVGGSAEDLGVDKLGDKLHRALAIQSGEAKGVVTGTLASLIEGFPPDLVFEPEDEDEPIHLNRLPEELLILIIRKLDHTTIERFAAVSRKARALTLDPGIWR
jgi:F-box protein 9